jgi:hypothetical protein
MENLPEEDIRAALESMDTGLVTDALALLLAEKKEPARIAETLTPEFDNFAQAILFLKKNYDFAELDSFSTEADLVYVSVGERRILLTERGIYDEPPPGTSATAAGVVAENGSGSGRFSHLEM